MAVKMKCRNCKSTYNFASLQDARGAVCDCGSPLRRIKRKKKPEAHSTELEPEQHSEREWNIVSDIAAYGMKGAFIAVAYWAASLVLFLMTHSPTPRSVYFFSGWVLGFFLLVELVCFGMMAASSFRIAGLMPAAIGAGTCLVPLGILLSMNMTYESVMEEQRRENSMRQILLAMDLFSDVYVKIPAPASYDADDQPLLSWRVHILPFLDQQELYDQFHLDEPWDSEHNKTLIEAMPKLFQTNAPVGHTNFLLVLGEDSAFSRPAKDEDERRRGIGLHQRSELPSRCFWVVEAPRDQSVIWTKPSDWNYEGTDAFENLQGFREKGVMVGGPLEPQSRLADVRYIGSEIDEADWQTLLPLVETDNEESHPE